MPMNSLELALRLIAGVVIIFGHGFFVAIEFGLTRARQYSEEEFKEPGLERAWEMTQDLEIYLTGCQVGITSLSIAIGIIAEPALAALFKPLFGGTVLASVGAGVILAYLVLNLVHLTHAEQSPTYLGVERSKQVCRYGATPLYWFTRIIWPVLRFGDIVAKWTLRRFGVEMTGAWLEAETIDIETRGDLHKRFSTTLEQSDLPDERRQEVMNALAVGEVSIQSSTVPREEIVALSTNNSLDENLTTIEEHSHARYPLVGDDLDDFRGIVYLPSIANNFERLTNGEVSIEDIAESPMTLPADEEVSDAIDRFQDEHHELALVEDNDEVVGLLTITDTFEAVMGELEDPFDHAQIT